METVDLLLHFNSILYSIRRLSFGVFELIYCVLITINS